MSARIRFRPRIIKKHVFFSCPARALNCCRFSKKKHLILVNKKTIPEKTKFISGNKKAFLQLCFFCLFFLSPSLTLFKIGQFFFISLFSLPFPEIYPMFFYLVALINFSEIGEMFFFPKCFFNRPPSLDFVFFRI